jgi:Zn-dependent M16 (insulinase) family peptidase
MQGVQNTQEELMELRARRLMYPEGNGFRYETGGMMEQLRVLTADRIREFHKEMYQPKNLCLVLTGEVNHGELLQILNDFEDTILEDVPSLDAPFKRPWTDSKPTPPIAKTILETVQFPEEDESMGEVLVGYLGPSCNDHLSLAALGILLIYLCGSSISVLENTLVEKENLCSMITYTVETRLDMAIWFTMNAVETDKLQMVHQRLIDLLKETAGKELDMTYLNDCIKRWRRQIKNRCENAGSFFADPIIEDHLFGNRDGSDLQKLTTIKELDMLEKWDDKQWRTFFSKWIADAKHISILGQPSKELSDKITADEQARVEAQQKKLGEDGMKKLAEKLKQAQEENDKPIPDSLLEKFPVPE